MSDTVLALKITVLLLAMLAAWVPLLHMAERLTRKSAIFVARELPESRDRAPLPEAGFEREIA